MYNSQDNILQSVQFQKSKNRYVKKKSRFYFKII